jgi:aryl-alcohol dehydrogenase-like predicted oxidoreductase
MDYVKFGKTSLKVSRICLGAMHFGENTPRDVAFDIMSKAVDSGVNFFDTADVYGSKNFDERGVSEQLIGEWLAENRARRDKIVLATKVWGEMGYGPNDKGLSAYRIKRCCEASLKRLRTDYLDLYLMHRIDRTAAWDEVLQAMEQLVREGKVIYLGSSNHAGWHIATFNQEASKRHMLGLVNEQCAYSLLRRSYELEVIPACEAYGMAVTTWSPLAGGLLGGILNNPTEGRRASKEFQHTVNILRPQLEAWEKLCQALGETPAAVAIAWLLNNPRVTAPIIGPRTAEQLESATNALDVSLSQDVLAQIDKIFPGPADVSPEAYWAIPGIKYD